MNWCEAIYHLCGSTLWLFLDFSAEIFMCLVTGCCPRPHWEHRPVSACYAMSKSYTATNTIHGLCLLMRSRVDGHSWVILLSHVESSRSCGHLEAHLSWDSSDGSLTWLAGKSELGPDWDESGPHQNLLHVTRWGSFRMTVGFWEDSKKMEGKLQPS